MLSSDLYDVMLTSETITESILLFCRNVSQSRSVMNNLESAEKVEQLKEEEVK